MARSSVLVDIGAAHVAGGVFALAPGGRLRLERFAWETHEADPAGDATGSAGVAAALADAAARAGWSGPAAFAIPGHLALTKFIKTPTVAPSKRARILQFEASQAIPYPLEDVVWDHVVVAEESLDLEILLAAVKADAIGDLCAGAAAAGLAVERAAAGCLALRRGFRFNHPGLRQPVLLVEVGARSTHLLFLDGERFFVRTLALAGNAVTQAIADELALGFAPAEALKLAVLSGRGDWLADSPARAAVQRAAEQFGARLQLEIARSTANARRQTGGEPPTALWLAGGGSRIESLPAQLAAKLRLPVERYDPLARVDIAGPDQKVRDAAPALGVLVGLAAPAGRAERDANLLPAALTASVEFRRRRPWFAAAAVLAAAALLPPIIHYHRLAADAEAQVAALDAQMRPVRSLQSRIAADLEQLEQVKQQIAALQGLAATKSNWIAFLADLQGRLVKVEDVWLEKLAVVRPLAGAAPVAADGAPAMLPPLRLTLSGRLLDKKNPVSKVSRDSYARVKRLRESFAGSRFIASVEDERFDNSQPGILRFDFTLVVDPAHPL